MQERSKAGDGMVIDIDVENCVSSPEAAKLMGRHPSHVARLCREGKLPGAKYFGNAWFIPRESALNYQPLSSSQVGKISWEKRKSRKEHNSILESEEVQAAIQSAKKQLQKDN